MFCNNIILYRFFNMNLNDLIRDNMENTFVPAVRSKNSWHVTVIVNVAEASVWSMVSDGFCIMGLLLFRKHVAARAESIDMFCRFTCPFNFNAEKKIR